MDERQVATQGKICQRACIGIIFYFLLIAFVNGLHIFELERWMEFSDFLIMSAVLLLTYLSLAMIWKDAYFGPANLAMMKRVSYIFIALSIAEDGLLIADFIRGEIPSIVSICTLIMVNAIAFSLWYKKRSYNRR